MKTQIYSRIVVGLILFLSPFLSFSATYYVNDLSKVGDIYCTAIGSNAPGNGKSPSSPCEDLSWLLKSSNYIFFNGDVILVDAGYYYGRKNNSWVNVDMTIDKEISIIGAGSTTVFDEKSNASHFFLKIRSNNVLIQDIYVTKYAQANLYAQAFDITEGSWSGVKLSRVKVDNNGYNTGMYPIEIGSGSEVTFEGGGGTCNQSYEFAGGVRVTGSSTKVHFFDYMFIGNDRAESGSSIRVIDGKVDVHNSIFQYNSVHQDKAASCIYQEGGVVEVYDCIFKENTYSNTNFPGYGNTINILNGNFRITRSLIKDNKNLAGKDLKGSIGIEGGIVIIDSCSFSGNISNQGSDVFVKGGNVTANNCIFSSTGKQISSTGGTFKLIKCGNPTFTSNIGLTVDNIQSDYVANPSVPKFNGDCLSSVRICEPPTSGGNQTVTCPATTATMIVTGLKSKEVFYWYTNQTRASKHFDSISNPAWAAKKFWFDTSSTSTLSVISPTITATTTFYVVSGSDACSNPVAINVTYDCPVCTPPTPSFTSSASSVCPQAEVKYATQPGKTAYVWTITGQINIDYTIKAGGNATSDTLIIKWLTKGAKTVTVGYTDNSCASTTPATVPTTVSDLLIGAFTIQPSAKSCQNTPIKYAANKTNTNFKWQITGVLNTDYEIVAGGKTTDDTLIIKWKTSGPHTVKLDYTIGVGGCATTTSATNTTQGVANPSTLSFASSGSDVTQPTCKDTTGSVKINLPYAGKWNVKAIHSTNSALTKDTVKTLLNTPPFTLIFDSLYTGSYTFQIIDSNGCVSPVSSEITIDPQPISPAKPVLDADTIYCASNSYTLDKIVFKPKPNLSASESIKYYDKNGVNIPNPKLVTVIPNESYTFVFNNGYCDSKDKLTTIIPFDNGPTLPLSGGDINLGDICAVEKPSFNTLFSKLPSIDTSKYTFFISPNSTGTPILLNNATIVLNGGLKQTMYYSLADKKNGCKNITFAKIEFILDEGPTGLSLNLNGKQLFCGFSNPTVAKLDTAIVNKTNIANSLVWYASETATTPLPGNTPLIDGFYFAAEKPSTGCESFVRKKIEAIIQDFNPTTLDANNIYSFCKGSSKKVLDLPITPNTSANFVWLDSYKKEIKDQTIALIPGIYYGAEKLNGCISDKYKEILVKFESPIISVAPTKLPTCGVGNGALKVVGGVTGYTYKWSKNGTPMTDIGEQISNLPSDYTIKYSVIVEDTKGCKAYDTTQFSDCEPPGIPHVLTLNKDGKNDVFKLYYHTKYPNCKLSIFNRWGAMVFESKDIPYKDDWDGKPNVSGTLGSGELPTGTYFYLIDKGDGSALESGYIELVK